MAALNMDLLKASTLMFGEKKFVLPLRFDTIIRMSKAFEEIRQDAIRLPREQRLALAGVLLELDDPSNDSEAEIIWEQEILARIQAIDAGTAKGVSYDEVMRLAEDRLA